ncbi:MAG: NADH-quinone oxidoreductase subunit N [Actinobacteria bacterium]|nr:NADH-quinone oxidoreductase subunit N [Actinomycetota bacterium]
MTGYWLIAPEVIVTVGALIALFGNMLPGKDRTTALLCAGLCVGAAVAAWLATPGEAIFGGLLTSSTTASVMRAAILLLTAVWLLWLSSRGYQGERSREAVAMALFSVTGALLLTHTTELITMFIALELATIPAYMLMGYRRRDIHGLEGALKYFLLSMLTSLIMLYGLSFLYGLTGTTHFGQIAEALPGTGTLGLIAAVLTMVGLFAKLSAAPFHFWAPDSYAGAPAASVAFVSTVPKMAGVLVLIHLVQVFQGIPGIMLVLAFAAAASMLLGNLSALGQTDTRRLMAYSGVAHTGYLLIGLAGAVALGGAQEGYLATIFYAIAYSIPSLAIMLVVAEEGDSVADMTGLATRRPWVAWAMLTWLVSLIGIPPLAGFFGKLYLFQTGLQAGLAWLVLIGVATSIISAAYYFRIVRAMFLASAEEAPDRPAGEVAVSRTADAALAIALVATVAVGVGASLVMRALGWV